MTETRPKRFYTDVTLEEEADGTLVVALDGRRARTPGRHVLGADSRALAEAIAEEWAGQGEEIDLGAMPLTRLQGFALDGGEAGKAAWAGTVLAFAGSDLLCYRAPDPALAKRQADEWQPWLDRLGEALGGTFAVTEGIVAVEQPAEVLGALSARLSAMAPGSVFAIKLMAEILGSAVLALGVAETPAAAEAAYEAARLDERFQEEQWGVDAEAAARDARIREEFSAIVRFLTLGRG